MFSFLEIYKQLVIYNNLSENIAVQNNLKKVILQEEWVKVKCTGFCLDSRKIQRGQVFVAICGKKSDGGEYAKQALEVSGSFVITEKLIDDLSLDRQLIVKCIKSALRVLAESRRLNCMKVAITGSVGKTSTVNLLASSLRKCGLKVYQSEYSFNTADYGVPISILNCPADVDVGVFELGMSNVGEIYRSAKLLKPDISVILNVKTVHMENFLNLDAVANAKGELIEHTRFVVLVPSDRREFYKKSMKRCMEDVVIDVNDDGNDDVVSICNGFMMSSYVVTKKIVEMLGYSGRYALEVFEKFQLLAGRGKSIQLLDDVECIDSSYNANADTMIEALNMLMRRKANVKIVVLGDILELGRYAESEHSRVLDYLLQIVGIDYVMTVGSIWKRVLQRFFEKDVGNVELVQRRYKGFLFVDSVFEACLRLEILLEQNVRGQVGEGVGVGVKCGDSAMNDVGEGVGVGVKCGDSAMNDVQVCVLIKGSRGMELDKIIEYFCRVD